MKTWNGVRRRRRGRGSKRRSGFGEAHEARRHGSLCLVCLRGLFFAMFASLGLFMSERKKRREEKNEE